MAVAEEHVARRERRSRRARPRRGRSPCSAREAPESGPTIPWTRSRATPPSGKMEKRRCVARPADGTSKRFSQSPRSGDRGRSSVHATASSSAGDGLARRLAGLERAGVRVVAAKVRRVDDDPAHDARQPQPDRGTSRARASRRRRVSQPSIHLPRSVYSPSRKTGFDSLSRFSFGAKNSSLAASTTPPTRSEARSTSSRKSMLSTLLRASRSAARRSQDLAATERRSAPRVEDPLTSKIRLRDDAEEGPAGVGRQLVAMVESLGPDLEGLAPGRKTTKSASKPGAIAPLRDARPASLAGAAAIQSASTSTPAPRRCAALHDDGERELERRDPSPRSRRSLPTRGASPRGGRRRVVGDDHVDQPFARAPARAAPGSPARGSAART